METTELIDILTRGEDTRHQFKTDVRNVNSLAAEIVAFSNTAGGRIFIGVNDDGTVRGLTNSDIARLNELISNASSQNVRPPVNVRTDNVSHPSGIVLVITVPEGISKPYMDKDGTIWVKSGADKRRATSREELQRLFQQAGLVHADETPVPGLGTGDLDIAYFDAFFEKHFGAPTSDHPQSLPVLLDNMNLMRAKRLNLAGALLFAKNPQFALPAFIVKAVAFPGVHIEDDHYLDSRDLTGKLAEVFQQTISFILANTHAVQNEQSVNSLGQPEIPRIVWEELIANALIHRDYFISAPVRVLVFTDRIEMISPGHLPNNLTVENIKSGNSNIRNPILASFAAKLLPYRGLGSGILRALRAWPHIDFVDDRDGNLFKVTVKRPVPDIANDPEEPSPPTVRDPASARLVAIRANGGVSRMGPDASLRRWLWHKRWEHAVSIVVCKGPLPIGPRFFERKRKRKRARLPIFKNKGRRRRREWGAAWLRPLQQGWRGAEPSTLARTRTLGARGQHRRVPGAAAMRPSTFERRYFRTNAQAQALRRPSQDGRAIADGPDVSVGGTPDVEQADSGGRIDDRPDRAVPMQNGTVDAGGPDVVRSAAPDGTERICGGG
jgi:ATP-dependent DNA helicase RecG